MSTPEHAAPVEEQATAPTEVVVPSAESLAAAEAVRERGAEAVEAGDAEQAESAEAAEEVLGELEDLPEELTDEQVKVVAEVKKDVSIHDLGVSLNELPKALLGWLKEAFGVVTEAELLAAGENPDDENNDVAEEVRADGERVPQREWLWPDAKYFSLGRAGEGAIVTSNPQQLRGAIPLPNGTTLPPRPHYGVDLSAPIGVPIIMAQAGARVVSAAGSTVRVMYRDGTMNQFHHMDTLHVKAGDKLKKGETIGTTGNKGKSTGPHLHVQAYNSDGTRTDPLDFLEGSGLQPLGGEDYRSPAWAGNHSGHDHDHS